MSVNDFQKRIAFCQKVKNRNLNSADFWTKHIAIYSDACGFEYKTNPFDRAHAPKS